MERESDPVYNPQSAYFAQLVDGIVQKHCNHIDQTIVVNHNYDRINDRETVKVFIPANVSITCIQDDLLLLFTAVDIQTEFDNNLTIYVEGCWTMWLSYVNRENKQFTVPIKTNLIIFSVTIVLAIIWCWLFISAPSENTTLEETIKVDRSNTETIIKLGSKEENFKSRVDQQFKEHVKEELNITEETSDSGTCDANNLNLDKIEN